VGGFDANFRVAGDDVDICWRIQEAGHRLGFSPAAMVWHHRRNSVRAYWRQQRGYGRAEALLERKWPERYNAAGHVRWGGRLYGRGVTLPLSRRRRVNHGRWGFGLFQSIYEPAPGSLSVLPLMPEWYLVIAALALVSGLGAIWRPLLLALPVLAGAVLTAVLQAVKSTQHAAPITPGAQRRVPRSRFRAMTMFLYLVQPAARLWGRLAYGLAPWRLRRLGRSVGLPVPRVRLGWSEAWEDPEARVGALERALLAQDARVVRGDAFARWDLEVAPGPLGRMRARLAIEEHGQGRQLVRMRSWPRCPGVGLAAVGLMGGACAGAFLDGNPLAGIVLAVLCAAVIVRIAVDLAVAAGALSEAFERSCHPPGDVEWLKASDADRVWRRGEVEAA
jgi:hypothetical protein